MQHPKKMWRSIVLTFLIGLGGVAMSFAVQTSVVYGAEFSETIVTTPEELKRVMENPVGSHVKLGANITFAPAAYGEDAIVIPDGNHLLNLNGYTIQYVYTNGANEKDGSPIRQTGTLTINGEGSVIGGYCAIENDGQLIINGGKYTGLAASAIRTQGSTTINGGTLSGRFGEIWLENGVVVDNIGAVKRINNPFKSGGIRIENGVATGSTSLNSMLVIDDVTFAPGAGMTITEKGALIVNGTLVGESQISLQGGILIKNGLVANQGDFQISGNLTLDRLEIPEGVHVMMMDYYDLTIRGELVNHGTLTIRNGCRLTVHGDALNHGQINSDRGEDVTIHGSRLGDGFYSTREGSPGGPESGDGMGGAAGGRMERAAEELYTLGLFKGTGTDEMGQPIYDLMTAPTRQVAITMLVRLLGKEEEALTKEWNHPFTDVDSWANSYVGYAYANGLTKGMSDHQFGANQLVSTYQYLTFSLRALGYDDSQGDFKWDNPNLLTEEIKLTEGDYQDNNAPFYRGDVAILSHMALQREMKNGSSLMEYLVNHGAVQMEKVRQIGLDHVVQRQNR